MKKLISLCLVLALMMSLSVTAFANETGVGTGIYSTEVTGTYVPDTTASDTVFSVDISWEGMSFTYHAAQAPVWDTTNHTYTNSVAARWEGRGTITVTNHSNADIVATPSYKAAANYESAGMDFGWNNKVYIDSAAEYGRQQSRTITVTPTGSLPANTENKTIGTITVTIGTDPVVTNAKTLINTTKALLAEIKQSDFYNTDQKLQSDTPIVEMQIQECEAELAAYKAGSVDQDEMISYYTDLSYYCQTLQEYFEALQTA